MDSVFPEIPSIMCQRKIASLKAGVATRVISWRASGNHNRPTVILSFTAFFHLFLPFSELVSWGTCTCSCEVGVDQYTDCLQMSQTVDSKRRHLFHGVKINSN